MRQRLVRCCTMKTSRPWSYQTYEYPPAAEREDGCSRGFGATDAALLGRPEGLCAQLRACGGTRPRERAGVRDAFILDTLASIDPMVFVRVACELADYRPTAGEKVLTDTQREAAQRMQ